MAAFGIDIKRPRGVARVAHRGVGVGAWLGLAGQK